MRRHQEDDADSTFGLDDATVDLTSAHLAIGRIAEYRRGIPRECAPILGPAIERRRARGVIRFRAGIKLNAAQKPANRLQDVAWSEHTLPNMMFWSTPFDVIEAVRGYTHDEIAWCTGGLVDRLSGGSLTWASIGGCRYRQYLIDLECVTSTRDQLFAGAGPCARQVFVDGASQLAVLGTPHRATLHLVDQRDVATRRNFVRSTRRCGRRSHCQPCACRPPAGVVVTKFDRLGRSTRELLDLIDRISKAGASFRSLGDGSAKGRLLSTLLAAIAEFERELRRRASVPTSLFRVSIRSARRSFGIRPCAGPGLLPPIYRQVGTGAGVAK
jgi:Resolvase, N terminal domain